MPSTPPHGGKKRFKSGAPVGKEKEGQSSEANDTVPGLCSVSFHRNHTATVRSQVENPTVSHVENEYSQPPRTSQVSAYPGKQRPMLPGRRRAGGSTGHVIAPEQGCPGGEGALIAL